MKRNYQWLNHLTQFFAVILGVGLAFYINEGAKNHQERQESLTLMESLVTDLSDDIKIYEDYQIPYNSGHQDDIIRVVELLTADSLENIGTHLLKVFQVENSVPTTSTYSSMKSSGKLTVIEDLNIRKRLNYHYEALATESVRKGEYQAEFFTSELMSWFTKNMDLAKMELLHKDELVVLQNKLIIYESLIAQKVKSYEDIVEDSKELKAFIAKELKSN